MKTNESKKNGVLILSVEDRLDSNTSEAFEQLIMGHIDSGTKQLVIDFNKLDYISSAGLRVLLMAAKRLKSEDGELSLCGMKSHIRGVFEISGFLSILTVVDDVDAAVTAMS